METGGTTMTTTSTAQATASKPDYLGLLNAISLAESRAGEYLKAWAEVTPDADLRRTVALVAARETTHGEVFRQLIERLGFSLREREDPTFAERLRLYGDPTVPDLEKVRYGRYGDSQDGVEQFFKSIDARIADGSLDPLTCDTLRWYVREERDSGEMLREAYACVEGQSGNSASGADGGAEMVSADARALMACMSEGFAALQQSIAELAASLAKQEKSARR
jgi:rubrerythrin